MFSFSSREEESEGVRIFKRELAGKLQQGEISLCATLQFLRNEFHLCQCPLERRLMQFAASVDCIATMDYLINKGVDFRTQYSDCGNFRWDMTPINIAARQNSLNVVRYLMNEKDVEEDVTDRDNRTPLHHAAHGNALQVIKFLVGEMRADIEAEDDYSLTPVHYAISKDTKKEVIDLLLPDSCYLNMKCDLDGMRDTTIVHRAFWWERDDIALQLMEAGAESDAGPDFEGCTPLYHYLQQTSFRERDFKRILEKFSNYAYVDAEYDRSAAHVLVKRIVDKKSAYDVIELDEEFVELAKEVFQRQENLNVIDGKGETPFNYLTSVLDCSTEAVKIVQLLVENGALFNANDYRTQVARETTFRNAGFCMWYLRERLNRVLSTACDYWWNCGIQMNLSSEVERAIDEDIRRNGYCDVTKVANSSLVLKCMEVLEEHFPRPVWSQTGNMEEVL